MIEKIPLEAPKAASKHSKVKGYRLYGVGLTMGEEAALVKINEIIDVLNS